MVANTDAVLLVFYNMIHNTVPVPSLFPKYSTVNKSQDRRRNVRVKINWKGVRQGCPLSPTLNIYLEDLMKNSYPSTGGVNIGGRRIKCLRFADDMALLADDRRMLKNMFMELNDRCEDYGMININKAKNMVIGRKPN